MENEKGKLVSWNLLTDVQKEKVEGMDTGEAWTSKTLYMPRIVYSKEYSIPCSECVHMTGAEIDESGEIIGIVWTGQSEISEQFVAIETCTDEAKRDLNERVERGKLINASKLVIGSLETIAFYKKLMYQDDVYDALRYEFGTFKEICGDGYTKQLEIVEHAIKDIENNPGTHKEEIEKAIGIIKGIVKEITKNE